MPASRVTGRPSHAHRRTRYLTRCEPAKLLRQLTNFTIGNGGENPSLSAIIKRLRESPVK
jgi:hypothetical protein